MRSGSRGRNPLRACSGLTRDIQWAMQITRRFSVSTDAVASQDPIATRETYASQVDFRQPRGVSRKKRPNQGANPPSPLKSTKRIKPTQAISSQIRRFVALLASKHGDRTTACPALGGRHAAGGHNGSSEDYRGFGAKLHPPPVKFVQIEADKLLKNKQK